MNTIDDDLRAIVRAMPASWKDGGDFTSFLERHALERPDYWLQPVSEPQAAAFMGITANALANRRVRGRAPDCWGELDGRITYRSRLDIARWIAARIEMAQAA